LNSFLTRLDQNDESVAGLQTYDMSRDLMLKTLIIIYNLKLNLSTLDKYYVISINQGGPNFFFPWAKNRFPIVPKDQETPPGTVYEK
jgi:hypothetical protein